MRNYWDEKWHGAERWSRSHHASGGRVERLRGEDNTPDQEHQIVVDRVHARHGREALEHEADLLALVEAAVAAAAAVV